MNIRKTKQQAKALITENNAKPSYFGVLIEIEQTIQQLSKLYSSPRITAEKKTYLEKTIKDADTRAMAILTILRNLK